MKLTNFSIKKKSAVPLGRTLCVRTIDKPSTELLLRSVVHFRAKKMRGISITACSDHANDLVLAAIDERIQFTLHFCLHLFVASRCGDELDSNLASELLDLSSLRLGELDSRCSRWLIAEATNENQTNAQKNRHVSVHFRLLSKYDLPRHSRGRAHQATCLILPFMITDSTLHIKCRGVKQKKPLF